jgi:hypothetical protein
MKIKVSNHLERGDFLVNEGGVDCRAIVKVQWHFFLWFGVALRKTVGNTSLEWIQWQCQDAV